MAYMYPETNHADNRGEAFMYDNFKALLPSGFVCYHNRFVGTLEFDFVLLIPGRGILVCEVKGHTSSDIKKVDSTGYILKDDTYIHSPFEQAKKYSRLLAATIKNALDRDIPIIPIVCYPFINNDDFKALELHTLSPREETLLADDINLTLTNRLVGVLDLARSQKKKTFAELTLNMMHKIRGMFEPSDSINGSLDISEFKPQYRRRVHYSCVAVLPYKKISVGAEETYRQMVNLWRSGTKLCIISNAESVLDDLRIRIDNFIRELDAGSYDRFTLYDKHGKAKNNTFNLELYCVDDCGEDFTLEFDTELSEHSMTLLKLLDETTSFNMSQYRLEHDTTDRDIMVVAGAGTGKTTSMIARIGYLAYRHDLTADTLPDNLFMLTFTNDAARNMKQKLKDYFQDYFLLTMDYEALRLSECVEGMRIGTIHALSKRILQHYSVSLGLGKTLQIVSGKYEKDRFLTETLNEYVESNREDCNSIGLPMYELQSRLSDVMDKLHNKNSDLLKDKVDWGNTEQDQALHNILAHVLVATERKVRDYFDSISAVRLCDLIIKMKELVREHSDDLKAEGIPVRYVFVDEFQDTDDVQIELIKRFRLVYNFSLFVVGDTKQCIYRFRGANDKAFDVLVPAADKPDWDTFELSKNYRTDKKLLQTFDKRFALWGRSGLLEYREADRLVGIKEYNFSDNENSYFYAETRWRNDAVKSARLVQILTKLIEDPAISKGEQIAILVRENWQIEKIKEICSQSGIGIETDVGGVLYKLQPAIDLYKLVKALQNYRDPKHLFNLYTTYYMNSPMPKELLFATSHLSESTVRLQGLFSTKLNPIPKWNHYVEAIKYEPILKVLREIVLDLAPWVCYGEKELTESDKLRTQDFYRHNLDAIFEKMAFGSSSDFLTVSRVERFLEIMILTGQNEQNREPLVSEQKTNVVCMTVHKAKGLEFHTVILPYMSSTIGSKNHKGNTDVLVIDDHIGYSIRTENRQCVTNDYYQQFKSDEEEDRRDEEARILYVALTRAKKRLIYFDDQKSSGTTAEPKNWQALLRGEGAQ
ncbi:UvrD-helicase domain-containing protein [Dehalobacterium formicoaceticum]|uniref:UvrD-helicase domain-containing protein n=1 Tax=Dehalobacterium formicoaceticum TaxID=51515 RepID=UPI0031F6E238